MRLISSTSKTCYCGCGYYKLDFICFWQQQEGKYNKSVKLPLSAFVVRSKESRSSQIMEKGISLTKSVGTLLLLVKCTPGGTTANDLYCFPAVITQQLIIQSQENQPLPVELLLALSKCFRGKSMLPTYRFSRPINEICAFKVFFKCF